MFLFLFSILGTAIIFFAIAIYLLMDSGSSLEKVNRLTKGETKVEKSEVEPKKSIEEELKDAAKSVVDTAVDFVETLDKKSKDEVKSKDKINTKEEPKTETKKKKEKSIFDYWWSILIALWLFKGLFKRS